MTSGHEWFELPEGFIAERRRILREAHRNRFRGIPMAPIPRVVRTDGNHRTEDRTRDTDYQLRIARAGPAIRASHTTVTVRFRNRAIGPPNVVSGIPSTSCATVASPIETSVPLCL